MKPAIRVLLFALFISGCGTTVREEIIKYVNQKCEEGVNITCKISMSDATKFKWEKMYVFPDWTTSDSITKVLGFLYTGGDVPDDHSRMIFTLGSSVVHEEDVVTIDYKNSSINFADLEDSVTKAKLLYLSPAEAVFKIKKGKIGKSCDKCFNYVLKLTDRP